jgi:hypothetical protein
MNETEVHEEMLQLKLKAFGISSEEEAHDEDEADSNVGLDVVVYTPYGEGRLVEKRIDTYNNGDGGCVPVTVTMNVIRLDFGATLYRPAPDSTDTIESPASNKAQGTLVGVIRIIRFESSLAHLLNRPLFRRWQSRERRARNSTRNFVGKVHSGTKGTMRRSMLPAAFSFQSAGVDGSNIRPGRNLVASRCSESVKNHVIQSKF